MEGQKRDRLRWNDVAKQPAPQATLSSVEMPCRLAPVRPQRVSPSGDSKTQPTHGRPFSALHSPTTLSHVSLPRPSCATGRTMLFAPSAKTFIALRHIIR